MKQMKSIQRCNNSTDTTNYVINKIASKSYTKVLKELSTKFYNADSVIRFLYDTLLVGGNSILYGPGGFGKSEIVKEFFKLYDIPIITKVGHSSMDVEALLGIPNIKKLTEESEYEIVFEKSIFRNRGVLILEEFLDVKPTVAAALKDVITEGGYREGGTFIESRIGPIIICSNKSPDEVSIDASTSAFYRERFPFNKLVEWPSYTTKDYLNLLNLKFPNSDSDKKYITALLCEKSCGIEKISPRIAIKAFELFNSTESLETFKYVSGINTSNIDQITEELTVKRERDRLLENIKILDAKFNALLIDESTIHPINVFIEKISEKLKRIDTTDEELLKEIGSLLDTFDEIKFKVNEKILKIWNKNKSLYPDIHRIYELI